MTVVKAAAVQLSPVLYSREGTVDKVCRRSSPSVARACSSPPSRRRWCRTTRISPSCSRLTRWAAEHYRLLEQAVTVPSDATRAIGEACKESGIVVSIGVNERDRGTISNATYS